MARVTPVTDGPSGTGQAATGNPGSVQPRNSANVTAFSRLSSAYAALPQRWRRVISIIICISTLIFFFFPLIGPFVFGLFPNPPQIQLSAAAAAPLNANSTTTALNLTLLITNPNAKFSIHYNWFDVAVFYGEDDFLFTQTKLAPLVQSTREETLLHIPLSVVADNAGEEVVNKVMEDQKRGSIIIWVRVWVTLRVKRGRLTENKIKMWAFCYHVEIGYKSSNAPGFSTDLPKECEIEFGL